MIRSRAFMGIVVALVAGVLAGCGSSSTPTEPEAQELGDRVAVFLGTSKAVFLHDSRPSTETLMLWGVASDGTLPPIGWTTAPSMVWMPGEERALRSIDGAVCTLAGSSESLREQALALAANLGHTGARVSSAGDGVYEMRVPFKPFRSPYEIPRVPEWIGRYSERTDLFTDVGYFEHDEDR